MLRKRNPIPTPPAVDPELMRRFQDAKARFEAGTIEKISTAFYSAAMLELMQTYNWTPEEVNTFLLAVTEKARALLFIPQTKEVEAVNGK